MTAGTVNIDAADGSIYGDGRTDCCTIPNASGNHRQSDGGKQHWYGNQSGLAVGCFVRILANQSTATTSADASQITCSMSVTQRLVPRRRTLFRCSV